MTEQDLVNLAKAGDKNAFEQLVLANEKQIYNLCRRLVSNPDDASELAQEAFLNAWRGLPGFQGDSAFSTWVYRLASNVCIDFLRKEKRRHSVSATISLDTDGDETRQAELPDERYTPERELDRRELLRTLSQCLESLSDQHRQILVMRELSGLSYAEIGAVLGLEDGTVKSRIARARVALRKELAARGNFFYEGASSI